MDKRMDLENNIQRQIKLYEEDTGIKVDWVNVERVSPIGFDTGREKINIKVKIKSD